MEFNLNGAWPCLRPVNGDPSGSDPSVTDEANGTGKCDRMQKTAKKHA